MEDIAVKVTEIDQRSKSNTHRLDKVEERQDNLDKLVSSVSALANEQTQQAASDSQSGGWNGYPFGGRR